MKNTLRSLRKIHHRVALQIGSAGPRETLHYSSDISDGAFQNKAPSNVDMTRCHGLRF